MCLSSQSLWGGRPLAPIAKFQQCLTSGGISLLRPTNHQSPRNIYVLVGTHTLWTHKFTHVHTPTYIWGMHKGKSYKQIHNVCIYMCIDRCTYTHTVAYRLQKHTQILHNSQKDSNIFQLTHSPSINSFPLAELILGEVLHFSFLVCFFPLRGSISSTLQHKAVTHFIRLKLSRSIVSIPSLGHWPKGAPPQHSAPNQPLPPQKFSSIKHFHHQQ